MNTYKTIILARKHLHNGATMATSAELCLSDAIKLYDDGDFTHAKSRAIKSLAYSVGVFHKDYQRAAK